MLLLVYHHLGDSWESAPHGVTSRLLCFTTGFPGAPKGSPLQLFSLCSNLCIGAVAACRSFQVRDFKQKESSVEQGHIKNPREQSMTSLVTSHNDKSP